MPPGGQPLGHGCQVPFRTTALGMARRQLRKSTAAIPVLGSKSTMQVGWLGCLRAQPVDAKVPYLRLARRRPTASTTDRAYVRAIPASPDSSGPGTSPRVLEYARVFAGALLTLAVAWSTPLGQISDTETEVSCVGFMAQPVCGIQDGAAAEPGPGCLFDELPARIRAPTWVAQRLW